MNNSIWSTFKLSFSHILTLPFTLLLCLYVALSLFSIFINVQRWIVSGKMLIFFPLRLINNIDRTMTDVTIDDVILFSRVAPHFELTLELYARLVDDGGAVFPGNCCKMLIINRVSCWLSFFVFHFDVQFWGEKIK